jgi:CDP-glucose 4,6-dehydratase
MTVEELVSGILSRWPSNTHLVVERDESAREAQLLRLDCSKANQRLKWRAAWKIDQTLDAIVAWYKHFYTSADADMYDFTVGQIEAYTHAARAEGIAWACTDRRVGNIAEIVAV